MRSLRPCKAAAFCPLGSGALAAGVTVSSGGHLTGPGVLLGYPVTSGILNGNYIAGLVSGVTVGSAVADFGPIDIASGGLAENLTVNGGALIVDVGATTSGVVLAPPSGPPIVINMGIVTETFDTSNNQKIYGSSVSATVESGAEQFIESGGFDSGTIVLSGGAEYLLSGGVASGVTISAGGLLELDGPTLVSAGQTFSAGPFTSTHIVSGVTLHSGASLTVSGATVLSGGTLTVASGGRVNSVTVSAGGALIGSGELDGSANPFVNSVAGQISGLSLGDPGYNGSTNMSAASLEIQSGGSASSACRAPRLATDRRCRRHGERHSASIGFVRDHHQCGRPNRRHGRGFGWGGTG